MNISNTVTVLTVLGIGLFISSCNTGVALQSSRIHSKYSIGGTADKQFHKLKPAHLDTVTGVGLKMPVLRPFVGYTFGNKFEVTGYVAPFVLWDINAKMKGVERGNFNKFMSNMSLAYVLNTKGNISIAGSLFHIGGGGGIVVGTSSVKGHHEVEVALSPTLQTNWYWEANGEADSTVDIEIRQNVISLGLGVFFRPFFKTKGTEIGIGGKYTYPFDGDIYGEYRNAIKISPYFIQVSLKGYLKQF